MTQEGTLSAAVSAVKSNGGTIKLLKDVTFTDSYNETNLIENCTLANPIWGTLAFNNTADQSATSITVKHSTLANVKTSGSSAVVMQTAAVSPGLILGEGVKFLSYSTAASSRTATVRQPPSKRSCCRL